LDGLPGELVDGRASLAVQLGLEEQLRGAHADVAGHSDHALVWQGVLLVELAAAVGGGLLLVVVLGNVAELLLDVTNDFKLGRRGEGLTHLEQELLEESSQHTAGDFHLFDGVGDGEALENGDSVGDTISGINDETSGATSSVEGHDGLDCHVHILDFEGFEHDLSHSLSVLLGVARSLSEQDTLSFVGVHAEFVEEGVVPDALHVFPGLDDTGRDGVGQVEDTLLAHSLVTNVLGLRGDTLHGAGELGSTDDGGEHGTGRVFAGDTGLDHTGTIINDYNWGF